MQLLSSIAISILLAPNAVTAQFVGGWALRTNDTCPTEMTDCGLTGSSGDAHACCPDGQFCKQWKGYIYGCCASQEDCEDDALEADVCANDDWNLYIEGEDNPICCTSDLVGYEVYSFYGRGACVPAGKELESGESELVIQAQGVRGADTPSATSMVPSTTRTSPSVTDDMEMTETMDLEPTETSEMMEPTETDDMEPTETSMMDEPEETSAYSPSVSRNPASSTTATRSPTPTITPSSATNERPRYMFAILSVLLFAML